MKPRKLRNVSLMVVAPIFLGLLAVSLLLPRDWQQEQPLLLGRIWAGETGGGGRIFYVTHEERAFRKKYGSSTRWSYASYRTIEYSRYRIEARQGPMGDQHAQVVIEDVVRPETGEKPVILGPVPNGLWLWNNGMEVRDPLTLAVRFSPDMLRKLNPEIADTFPDEVEDVKVSAPHKALIFRSADLQYYQVDALTGKASLADKPKLENVMWRKTLADGFTYVQPIGRSRGSTSISDLVTGSFVTSTSLWYGLRSEDKLKTVSRWPRGEDRVYGDEWRSLYRVEYSIDDRAAMEIDRDQITQVGELKLLNAGFLQRDDKNVWDVAKPSSTLVLHKKDLKRDSPWHLGRLTRNGALVWDVSLGLADLHTVSDVETSAVFYGYPDYTEPTNNRPQLLVFVDPETGKKQIHTIAPIIEKKQGLAGAWDRLTDGQ